MIHLKLIDKNGDSFPILKESRNYIPDERLIYLIINH
jgi:hypothetical protein